MREPIRSEKVSLIKKINIFSMRSLYLRAIRYVSIAYVTFGCSSFVFDRTCAFTKKRIMNVGLRKKIHQTWSAFCSAWKVEYIHVGLVDLGTDKRRVK